MVEAGGIDGNISRPAAAISYAGISGGQNSIGWLPPMAEMGGFLSYVWLTGTSNQRQFWTYSDRGANVGLAPIRTSVWVRAG